MAVKVTVAMNSRADGDTLRRSMEDPTIRAVALVSGLLLDLPTIAQRRAVLTMVTVAVLTEEEAPRRPELRPLTPIEELPAMRLRLGDAGE